jgi:hypothetical protein
MNGAELKSAGVGTTLQGPVLAALQQEADLGSRPVWVPLGFRMPSKPFRVQFTVAVADEQWITTGDRPLAQQQTLLL